MRNNFLRVEAISQLGYDFFYGCISLRILNLIFELYLVLVIWFLVLCILFEFLLRV
jgi:hypothetical protein